KKKYINKNFNYIKKIALKNKIKIISSNKIEKKKNIEKLKNISPDLFLLISFKIISKKIWSIPKYGSINIHPSILPNYKGPSPINWVIINGEKYTGLTSFFINNKIDEGNIILQKKIKISKYINYNTLYKKLSILSKYFVIKTINKIINKSFKKKIIKIKKKKIIYAYKINNILSKINFNMSSNKIFRLILGLDYKKSAWCFLNTKNNIYLLNIYKINININKELISNNYNNIGYGRLLIYKKKFYIKTLDNFIELLICKLNINKIKLQFLDLYNGLQNKENIFLF
ncbi:MAG: hypothetical protein NHF85_00040, partial [Candidatus Shikimatogenerans sp. JK-2022]|nr:hypothetical protein [Candidatus Shikimatogenerans bostrichidophilus]